MRRGPRGHAAANAPAIQHDDRATPPSQFVSGRQSRDPGTDYDDICGLVIVQYRGVGHLGIHPKRPGALRSNIHGAASISAGQPRLELNVPAASIRTGYSVGLPTLASSGGLDEAFFVGRSVLPDLPIAQWAIIHSAFQGITTRSSSLSPNVSRKPMIAITNRPTYICSTANVLHALQIR